MPKQEFPFPMPDGWFCVLRSHELENGEVQSVKFCENEVAAFRTESGEIGVLDAYCGYSGINLAKDGMVSGENLVCKQHGIKWDTSGACAEIEADSNVPETAKEIKMFSYPVVDINGFIWAWHHLHQEAPEWEVPAIEGFNGDDDKWGKVHYYDYNINTVLQEIAENDVDSLGDTSTLADPGVVEDLINKRIVHSS